MKSFVASFAILCASSIAFALPAGWKQIKPGGETRCARGSEYSFLVHAGNPQKIIVSFAGGGACWDEFTCDLSQIYTDTAERTFHPVEKQRGIYDFNNVKNPYRDWTHIFIPYCTGDIHMGGGDTVYTRPDKTNYTIYHRGGWNTKAALTWMQNNFKTASEINIDGCSAGSYASVLWLPMIAEAYPKAKIFQFGDSGAGVAETLLIDQWQLQKNLPTWIPALDPSRIDWRKLNIIDVYQAISNYYPQARFSQYNHFHDRIQILYYTALGGNASDWTRLMLNNMEDTLRVVPNFRYYIAPGDNHCSMNSSQFYTTTVDGISLRDWLSQKVLGQDVENVKCKECIKSVK